MAALPPFQQLTLKKLSQELQHAATHAELAEIFKQCNIEAPPGSKHARIYEALVARQQSDRCANNVVAFLQALLNPIRFVGAAATFDEYRHASNVILAFEGYQVMQSGQIEQGAKATTLDEAVAKADRLRAELARRRVHPDVLKFCQAEYLDQNYFHAILEATKSVAQKIRDRTGLSEDGAKLVDQAFGTTAPRLIWNSLRTSTERNEHTGTMDLLKGMFSLFRNPTAHDPKIARSYSEDEALELMTLVSLLHRRIDAAHRTAIQ